MARLEDRAKYAVYGIAFLSFAERRGYIVTRNCAVGFLLSEVGLRSVVLTALFGCIRFMQLMCLVKL